MPVTRRSFIGLSAAALAAFTLDPDRLLWRPGAKTFFLPSATVRPAGHLFWYVNSTHGGGAGVTPDAAMSSLAEALYAARSGDTIVISPNHVEMMRREGPIVIRQSHLNILGAAAIRAEFSF